MYTNRCKRACRRMLAVGVFVIAACLALAGVPAAVGQAPAAAGNSAQAPSPEELERLVGPIALYPDDLVAIILPASTNPLQIVQADRFLEKRKQDPKLPIDDKWDDSVKALVNYPEVIKQMSADLDWTADLGEAVVDDQGAVLDAVQAFRRKAQAAGNLKTDAKQVVEVEKEVIKIVPADPQVIYVPQYNPTTVVVYSTVPVYGYYPAPYPVYYYPYPPGAAFATGLIWGAAIGAAWHGGAWGCNWGGGTINNNININRNVNINNINRGRRQRQSRGGQPAARRGFGVEAQQATGAGRAARPDGPTSYQRVGDAPSGWRRGWYGRRVPRPSRPAAASAARAIGRAAPARRPRRRAPVPGRQPRCVRRLCIGSPDEPGQLARRGKPQLDAKRGWCAQRGWRRRRAVAGGGGGGRGGGGGGRR